MQSINIDLIQNAIEQLKTVALALMDDLEYYSKQKGASAARIDINQKRIDTLYDVCQMFTGVYNQIEADRESVNKYKLQVQDALFAREACAFFHGVSLYEQKRFLSQGIDQIYQQINECLKTGFRQIPFSFQDVIDEQKRKKSFEDLQINVSANGEVEYIRPNTPPIRTSTTTMFDWKKSFELLKSQKPNQEPNGKNNKN